MKSILSIILFVSLLGCQSESKPTSPTSELDLRPDREGTIHHPKYGDYQEMVPFKQGMTLMPGQSAEMQIFLPALELEAPASEQPPEPKAEGGAL